jgi:hypothetical protein
MRPLTNTNHLQATAYIAACDGRIRMCECMLTSWFATAGCALSDAHKTTATPASL